MACRRNHVSAAEAYAALPNLASAHEQGLDRMWITCTVGTTLLPCAWIHWLGGVWSSQRQNP
jgi:hypothetical protein